MIDKDHKLQCYTAKYKLKEAKYLLEKMKEPEIWNDHEIFGFYHNAFVYASTSVINYVHADFIYNGFSYDQRIKWYVFEKRENRTGIIENHREKLAIEKFRRKFSNELDKFLRDPIGNYFKQKRNQIAHVHWNADKWTSSTEANGKRIVHARRFEGFSSGYYKKTKGFIPLDLFDNRVSESDKETTLNYLCEEDLRNVCSKYLELLEEFIIKFDGEEYPIKSENSSASQDNNQQDSEQQS